MNEISKNLKACWLLADIGPYHVARFEATAELGDLVVVDAGMNISTAYESAATKSYDGRTCRRDCGQEPSTRSPLMCWW